ncbi:hypothetical protein Q5Y75_05645 [Ruegeria sp. 2205SS24-7]|uniref:hypothetical protein n=1 Tax=Ruegeria discodermiae TaxID=3064389 RepID=UPI002740799B|nr:hypothetical protein [Ruegeria sp. 2205SS24-7]MDP5216694.1 hypothetical protein [Ruegeria sp. 2205SS24-7]
MVQMAQSLLQAPPVTQEDVAGTGNLAPVAYDPSQDVATPQVDRFGDTIRAATKQPLAATKHFAGEVMDPENSLGERALAAGQTALSAAGTTYAFGAGLVGETLGGSPTNEKKLARDLMMMGEVAVPEMAGVSSGVTAAGKVARAAEKAAKPPTPRQEIARAADDLGIVPSLGATSKTKAQAGAFLEKVPGVGKVLERDATRFVGDVEEAFDKVRRGIGPASDAAGAGEALQGGLGKFVQRFEKVSTRLYNQVGKHVPETVRVESPNTVQFINDMMAKYEGQPSIQRELGLNRFASIGQDLEGGLTWRAMSDLRSSIGESIGRQKGPLSDMGEGRLKQMYAQLTSDMEAAVKQAGPQAEAAWKTANTHYRKGAQHIQGALDKTIKADSPERAFEAFVNMAKADRATADVTRMRKIRKSMPTEEWNTVSASIIDRLGKAPAGQQNAAGDVFSPSIFLTEWNKMSSDAKGVLVTPKARVQLDKLAKVSEGLKNANAERNFSNTGTVETWLAIVFGAGVDVGATAAAVGAANISARALTSERWLKAANRAARGDYKAMQTIARGGSPYAMDAQTILRLAAADAATVSPSANTDRRPPIWQTR